MGQVIEEGLEVFFLIAKQEKHVVSIRIVHQRTRRFSKAQADLGTAQIGAKQVLFDLARQCP